MIEINLIGVKVDEKSGRIKVTGWAEAAHEPVICAYSGNKKLAASVNFFTRADMVFRTSLIECALLRWMWKI